MCLEPGGRALLALPQSGTVTRTSRRGLLVACATGAVVVSGVYTLSMFFFLTKQVAPFKEAVLSNGEVSCSGRMLGLLRRRAPSASGRLSPSQVHRARGPRW